MINIVDINNLQTIKDALNKTGFFYIPFRESDKQLISELMTHCNQLFSASDEIKLSYPSHSDGLGFVPLNKQRLNKNKNDMRESYSYRIGQVKNNELYNKAVTELSYYAKQIFFKILESLDLNPNDYEEGVMNGFNTLSLAHYPAIKSDIDKQIYGISEHCDWGFITLLSTTENGLQVKINDCWVDVPTLDNHFIVNIGDMLEIISNGKYKSTEHRVLIEKEKYSVILFFESNLDFIVSPHEVSNKYKPIKFGDYINKKITESMNLNQ